MTRRHGLTLLEVLIAVTLMSLLTVTCIPLIRSSLAVVHEPPAQIHLDELKSFVELILDDPEAFGLSESMLADPGSFDLQWPDQPDYPAVTVHRLAPPEDAAHTWLIFTCEPWTISRWHALTDEANGQGDSD